MDLEAFKQQLLEHYVAMASLPWAKAQAWWSVNDLASRFPSVYGELPQLLVQHMKERASDRTP